MKKFYLLLLLVISACTAKPDNVSILENSNCKLPCWNNITVGQTSKDEVLQYIENSAGIDPKTIQITDDTSDVFDQRIFFSFRQGWIASQSPDLRVEIHLADNVVGQLTICGELNISINDIVNEVGEPQNIISGDNLAGSRSVILINPQQGISYTYDTDKLPDALKYEINPDIEIDCLDLFDPTLYTKLMDIGFFSSGHYNAEETLKVQYPWDGYGNLDEKYPPRQP